MIALGESLAIGFRALAISANYAAQEEDERATGEEVETELSRGALIFAFAVAIGFAVALFKVTPALITDCCRSRRPAGSCSSRALIRVTLFILYLA